ncbi:flavin reductase (DIM6/NTAB) family NADH-FMN oxidoreductase RutF [Friedmanniella endophytica]|uniref:Flavin reductase (DIM6/NTAB) family NADH-FMN oxidoreductase RutF n=1 Tax=Microlunatus kandeliicorticis TaxID=1759536 RepID=A0A7W3IPW0_9ACTN|nr:flavin reductase family protein [Microlunatus kandeliicorticis]MBA8793030.1 flavin reductase (DIM6/NTAB) family NADH-FMN oxidoreductase RutF [Microlunatus kandeliicorticis]
MTVPDRVPASSGATDPVLDDVTFRAAFRRHPAGVAVITTVAGEEVVGFTATSVISVSAAPPMLAFSVAARSSSRPALDAAATVVVNFLGADQADVSARFATSGIDRFRDTAWHRLPTGEPVLDGVGGWIRARIEDRVPVGGSLLVVLTALDGVVRPEASPLLYQDRGYHRVDPSTAV